MHKGKHSLAYTEVRRDNLPLVRAAEKQFESWGNALYAAGIDPNLYLRGKWRKRRMIAKRDRLNYGNVFSSSVPTAS
jgi:hypothetical protein